MALFAVIPQPGPNAERLGPAIAAAFDGAFQELNGGHGWLILARLMTPEQICERLGIRDGSNGSGVVLQVATYYGRASPDIWAWINANWGRIDV